MKRVLLFAGLGLVCCGGRLSGPQSTTDSGMVSTDGSPGDGLPVDVDTGATGLLPCMVMPPLPMPGGPCVRCIGGWICPGYPVATACPAGISTGHSCQIGAASDVCLECTSSGVGDMFYCESAHGGYWELMNTAFSCSP
jgi:hypothetical protein